jgi:hypothetical protein
MREHQEEMFTDTLNAIADGPMVTSYMGLTEALMRRFSEKGLTLETLSGRKMMNRSVKTLQRHAREFKLIFPDYTPRSLKPKKEAKDG